MLDVYVTSNVRMPLEIVEEFNVSHMAFTGDVYGYFVPFFKAHSASINTEEFLAWLITPEIRVELIELFKDYPGVIAWLETACQPGRYLLFPK